MKEKVAVEEGHRAFRVGESGAYRVVADGRPGRGYLVAAAAPAAGRPVASVCEPEDLEDLEKLPAGTPWRAHGRLKREDGIVCCKHAAVVMRRLEREGAVRFDGEYWLGV